VGQSAVHANAESWCVTAGGANISSLLTTWGSLRHASASTPINPTVPP
jgi:hypothetical protein